MLSQLQHLIMASMLLLLCQLLLIRTVLATGPYHTLDDIFEHQLAALPAKPPPRRYDRADFGYACLLAINKSLQITDGNLEFRPGQTHLRGNVETFLRFQFPCTASYNGSEGDQPQVWVTYSWCHNVSPGWRLTHSSASSLGEWVNPLIGFIIPSIIFCLTVARRRRINVPKRLFPQTLDKFSEMVLLLYKVPLAALIVTIDTNIWLITIVTMAGPMLLSGIYEAVLDIRTLTFVRNRSRWNAMTVRSRAHLLLAALLGNLDLIPAWHDATAAVSCLPNDAPAPTSSSIYSTDSTNAPITTPVIDHTTGGNTEATKTDSATILAVSVPREIPPEILRANAQPLLLQTKGIEAKLTAREEYPPHIRSRIETSKTQLNAMLEAQSTFGSSVGAAVIFYTGSFVYALIEVQSQYGNK